MAPALQILLPLVLLQALLIVHSEVLTPRYFNLAFKKKITATATCGDEGPELYCKLVGANANQDERVIQGQVCDFCNMTNELKNHPPEHAVDSSETWWQSPPLSRGMKYNEVNLTIDLGQEFHVAYVFVKMGISPRPGLWVLEKSTDYGKTFKPWQYFSDSPQDCERYFGKESLLPVTRDDSIICSTEYSQIVPLEGGEIPISLLNNRPSANSYFNSSVLQEWTRATNVRLRLLRTKNLHGHLMSVARQDPTVTRRYFYSIKDISIGGRCMCNGHADNCEPADPATNTNILECVCQHNTCGAQCATCCKGFEQKKWRISQQWDRFVCEPCNCHNHTTECTYDPEIDRQGKSLDIYGRYEGGGVCQNCQHNTEGINCNKCKPTFYRPYGRNYNEIDVCKPCNCDLHYSTGNCEEESGRCECRKEFNPPNCDSCAYGYFDYPNCKPCTCNLKGTDDEQCTPLDGLCPCKYNYAGKSCEICADGYYSPDCKNCECNTVGSVSSVCDKDSGNCTCKSKYAGRTCNQCEAGYYNYPTCKHCNCDISGTEASICDDVTGTCICKTGFGGSRCDQCLSGYYMEVKGRERTCVPCNCDPTGSTSTSCSADGKCNCLANFGGKQCDQCSPGYYKYPECLTCYCDVSGSIGSTCDDNGQCHCKPNFDGAKCDKCKEQFYNYPACEECNCDPRGVTASFAGCGSVPAGELCKCKERVEGRICNDCKPLFWNLQEYNPNGCEECNCYQPGTLGGMGACDTRSGQCVCKLNVGERQCNECQDGFYNLDDNNLFGCTECNCDIGGSIDNNCDKATGQCRCHSRVEGRRCDQPIRAHYFPTLHQFQYEVEEGYTPSGSVRYRNSDEVFPGYSWKGYVVFSMLQNEVTNKVTIHKPSLYRMVIKYANPLKDIVIATITMTPDSVMDITQTSTVAMRPTTLPQLLTVAGDKDIAPAPFVMNSGNWKITIKTTKEVMIDYFVLIPEAYYEATVLTKLVDKPCEVGEKKLCRHFAYPSVVGMPVADVSSLSTAVTAYIDNVEQLNELKATAESIPIISGDTGEVEYDMKIDPPGPYILLLEYVTPVNLELRNSSEAMSLTVRFKSEDGPETVAIININDCRYTAACRQAFVDDLSRIQIFNVLGSNNKIYLMGDTGTLVGVKSIIAIPEEKWHLDYITPRAYCSRRNGKCEQAVFTAAVDSKKVEAELGIGGERSIRPMNLDNTTVVVYLEPGVEPLKIESKVPQPGDYIFLVHYYQPDHPESSLDTVLKTDGQQFDASISVQHCPSNFGCRTLLKQADGNTRFPVNENFTIAFNADNGKPVWLDYVLVIAAPDFVDTALTETNIIDYTREFIQKCANNHYYITGNETGFCREAMFSITAEYNSGALACFCDFMGSTELECDTFGGQCPCKPNVIGRSCTACRTGFFGFPNCRPCTCPQTAICDDYGACICPKNVEGENCDHCKPYTFNFDVQRGCDDCNCNPLGVIDNRLQCEADNGNCACRENVIGRTCDHCVPGHFAFPECMPCTCDRDGTTDDVCDQATAQCYCKKHVTGQACDTCRDEYFNLQGTNPEGCTKCYCFGKTTRCASSDLSWVSINGMGDWSVVNVDTNRTLSISPWTLPPLMVNDSVITVNLVGDDANQKVVYFGAPDYYLGKRLTSYGGYLTYSILYSAAAESRAIAAADVIIGGNNGFIVHNSIEQPPAQISWTHAVKLMEEEFTNLDGSPVSRDQFMNTLVNIESIYIRATYEDKPLETSLIAVTLDIGVETYDESEDAYLRRASSVEQCQCPKAYRGMSCEQCAEGYYRLSSGFCAPCQCNGHSKECDVNTGVCLECTDYTMGDHCEMCIPGYHGDATEGTPRDCLICACPLPYVSNNFATSCDLSENGTLISCQCKPGYGGANCGFCTAGYYGVPDEIGDHCKPCNCSGNINREDPASCDSITGNCLKCVNNTAGAACNLCAPGFYGDAVFSKNCTACICDEFGMDHCDHTTGTCVCRPGVIGEQCDQCAPNHWGLSSGQGCTPCDCALASESEQCDPDTGKCKCANGVSGKHCDQCAAGFWNYTKEGCDHCNCNTGYSLGFTCNATGQCECLPGVIGEKCDRCPERWVLLPDEGCLECNSCTDALLFSIEDLTDRLQNETKDFKDKADSFFTTQRLNYISNQTQLLRPRVAELRNVEVEHVTGSVKTLETSAKNLLRSAEFAATDSDKQITRAAELAADADKILSSVRDQAAEAKTVVGHVSELATGLELSQQPKVDSALTEARQIKSDIAEKNLAPKQEQADGSYVNATNQIERMNVFVEPVNGQAKKFQKLVNETNDVKAKLDEMLLYTELAQRTAARADALNAKNRQSKFGNKVMSVTKLNADAFKDLIDAGYDISNTTYHNLIVKDIVENAPKALTELNNANSGIEARLEELRQKLPELQGLADDAEHHTTILRNRADNLQALAERENNNSRTQHAYTAASAYSSIVQEVGDAKNAADAAEAGIVNITLVTTQLDERVGPALNRSQELLKRAATAQDKVNGSLSPNLTLASENLAKAQLLLQSADDDDNAIQLSLPKMAKLSLADEIAKAEQVNSTVSSTLQIMQQLGAELAASKDAAQTLPELANGGQQMIYNLESFVKNIQEELEPNITTTYRSVKARQDDLEHRRLDADQKLRKLKELIEQARTVANRIQVGVTFDRLTTLQPRLPDTVDEMSTSSHVSVYFKTKEKDGLILYLGNPKDTMLRRTKSDDFMVVGVQNGYPYLVMDIGDSAESSRAPARIGSDKFVADNKWYQVIVDRVGRNVKLAIRESLDNGSADQIYSKEAVLPGQHTIFNLDRHKSKLYVGGAPSDANLQGVSFPAFEGQIEELMIGDTPVGLWNFVNAANLKGARQRDKLLQVTSGPQEYRFNGRSHVTLPGRGYLTPQKNHVQLFFRTYAPDGLIYLVGEGASFFSVQMQDGKVFLQVSLGNPSQELLIIGTQNTYNDGKWHRLESARNLNKCLLKVDSESIKDESVSSQVEITALDTMNFGGNNKGIVEVTSKGFDGCMRQISLDRVPADLSENQEAIGMSYGCQVASLVSLSGRDSYLRFVNITTENLQLTLKFKTSQPDGLIFVYVSRTQTTAMSDTISLSLIKGKLVVMSQREQLDTGLSTYNDSQWHVVTVTHNNVALKLVVDDFDYFSTDTPPPPLHILEGVLFIGGVQPGYVVGGKVGSKTPFSGCVADVTINGVVFNLLEPYSNNSVTFGRCGTTTSTGGVSPDRAQWAATPPTDVLPTPGLPPDSATQAYPTNEREPVNTLNELLPRPAPERTTTAAPVTTVTPVTTAAPTTTTVRPSTTTRRPAPQPEPGCALAYDPYYTAGDPDIGYRFGTRNDSRIEYSKLPGRHMQGFDLTISFRTFDRHGGFIFYAAADRDPTQFLAFYMSDAKLHYAFNCGSKTGLISSSKTYNDTEWHVVTLTRSGAHGKLTVDSDLVGEITVACNNVATLTAPYYYGGLKEITEPIGRALGGFYQPFKGCLKGLMMNGQRVTDIGHTVNSLRCADNVEEGVFFGASSNQHSNYLKVLEHYKVGAEVSISMEIRPRNSTGLLLSVHGKKDYLILELLENEVVASVENGNGPFRAIYRLPDKFSLCDGNWHKIHVVKSLYVVSVGVDGHFAKPGQGSSGFTDTRSALYIGGHERPINKVRGVKSRRGFTGCIKNIVIGETPLPIPLTAAGRDTHIGVCPLD